MKIDTFKKNVSELTYSNNLFKYVILGLTLSLLISVVANFSSKERIVIVPAGLPSGSVVSYDGASEDYYKAIALAYAELLGGVNSSNNIMIADKLATLTDSSIYPDVRKKILAISTTPESRYAAISTFFTPKNEPQVEVEDSFYRVFVNGDLTSNSYFGKAQQKQIVYELLIKIVGGKPIIFGINSYEGQAHNKQWVLEHKNDKKVEEK